MPFGRGRRRGRAAVGKAAALVFVPELIAFAAVAVGSSSDSKRQSGCEDNESSSETSD